MANESGSIALSEGINLTALIAKLERAAFEPPFFSLATTFQLGFSRRKISVSRRAAGANTL
jgi:hypothetical protein